MDYFSAAYRYLEIEGAMWLAFLSVFIFTISFILSNLSLVSRSADDATKYGLSAVLANDVVEGDPHSDLLPLLFSDISFLLI